MRASFPAAPDYGSEEERREYTPLAGRGAHLLTANAHDASHRGEPNDGRHVKRRQGLTDAVASPTGLVATWRPGVPCGRYALRTV